MTRSSGCSARDRRPWTGCARWIGPDCSSARSPNGPTSAAARSATPYHRYTVDMHLLRAFERTSRALAAPDAEDPVEVVAVDLDP